MMIGHHLRRMRLSGKAFLLLFLLPRTSETHAKLPRFMGLLGLYLQDKIFYPETYRVARLFSLSLNQNFRLRDDESSNDFASCDVATHTLVK